MDDLPPETFGAEIARELTCPLMPNPEFKAHIREDELPDFDKRDKRMLLTLSVIEQKLDFSIKWMRIINRHARALEAEQVRARQVAKEINWRFALVKWLAVTGGAGIVAALLRRWI